MESIESIDCWYCGHCRDHTRTIARDGFCNRCEHSPSKAEIVSRKAFWAPGQNHNIRAFT